MTQDSAEQPMDFAKAVSRTLGCAVGDLTDEADLIQLGLDSLAMMRLAGRCRREGLDITFADLVSAPNLGAWKQLAARRAKPDPVAQPAASVDEYEPFELALMQHAYWAGRQEEELLGGVPAHFYHEFDGTDVDPERLESAVRAVLGRHGMLRVEILDDGRQRIHPEAAWSGLPVQDLRDLPRGEAEELLGQMRDDLSHGRDGGNAGVLDVRLSLLPESIRPAGTRLHINLDMIAADALSLRVLLADLAHAYAHPEAPREPLGCSFPQYLAQRRALRASPERATGLEADLEYWRQRLPELPNAPQLPVLGTEPDPRRARVVRRHLFLDASRMRQFEEAARQHGVTSAMALATVFAETVQAFSADPDFLLNLPLFDREPLHDDVNSMVGDFTSSVLLAWEGARPGSFAERAVRLQDRFHQDAAHSGCSGVEVLREATRLRGERLLAPVVYTSALGLGELFPETVRDSFGEPSWIISQGPQVWLDAQVTEMDGGLLVNWDAREDAFVPGVLDAMFDVYRALLDRLLTKAAAWDSSVPALLSERQRQVRDAVNDTGPGSTTRRLHDGFFERAAAAPEAPALLWGREGRLSYGELRERALALAGGLRERGVVPGDLVAVSLPKGPEQIVGVLGVLAAGAAYLPLGIDQPAARRARITDAADVRLVLDDTSVPDGVTPLPAPVPGDPADLAYVIYTSGSTGEPKGVEVPHAAAMNTIEDLVDRFALCADDRALALSALDFDLSVFDVFAPLAVGGSLVCVEETDRRDAVVWSLLTQRHGATVVNCVPALLDMLVTGAGEGELRTLRLALLGGDWVPLDLPDRLREAAPDSRCVALGGTTETAIHSTVQEIRRVPDDWLSVPYGTPLRGVRCRVVDPLGRDCPDWTPGELWIGGASVALGYRRDGARTAERFLQDGGVRWYRTGDRARYRPDGVLEFLGRADHQVKVRGHRIELGEIEAALRDVPGVAQAVAVLFGERRLGAAVLGRGDAAQIRAHVGAALPSVMVPERVLVLDELPLTANGKIDRAALGKRLADCGTDEPPADDGPADEREHVVADVWAETLGVRRPGRKDDFFALGGDSLVATRVIAALRERGGGHVRLSELLRRPVLADFAAHIDFASAHHAPAGLAPAPAERGEPFPLTDVQRAYWLGRGEDFTLGGTGCHFYREYDIVDLDPERLEDALGRLVERHEMLRAVVDEDGRQRILPQAPPVTLSLTDAAGDPEEAFAELRATASHRVFDPGTWPLFAVQGVRTGRVTRLGIGIDNIALDALSILVFYTELATLYADPEAELPPLGVSFRDYVLQAQPEPESIEAARAYWNAKLAQLPPSPALPLAQDPALIERPRFVRHESRLTGERWQRITERARRAGLTPSGTLLAAFAEVLGRWSARPDLTLNLTLFDRREVHPDIGNVLGDFTSLMLVPSVPEQGETWLRRARRVQDELWSSLDHRQVSGVWVLRELARRAGEAEATMPVVFTSALGLGEQTPPAPFDGHVWGISQTPQVWLDHQVTESADGGVLLNWDVVDGLFPEGLVEDMFAAYQQLLAWLCDAPWDSEPPELLPTSQARKREAVNATGSGTRATLHHEFFRHAQRDPERSALLWGEEEAGRMSYGELSDRALRLATVLTENGVREGDTVAVALPKGPGQIVAVLGVLAAGASYLPVGVDQPAARRARILQLADARLVIEEGETEPADGRKARSVSPDAVPRSDLFRTPVATSPDALAYTIFTSGSSGEPKGVEITHQAAANTVRDVNERYGVGESDRALAVSALDFDLSVYDVFGPLTAGGAVVLIGEDDRRDARQWLRLVRRHRVTVWNSVPALLDMLLVSAESAAAPESLRLVLVSGDWVGLDLPGRLAEQSPWCRMVALGGATEAAIWSNAYEVAEVDPAWRSIPYGTPLRGQRYRVVDPHGRDCPDWVPGELWIGGAGVAQGYRGAPELTGARFVTYGHERWYRTGDLGRYWPDGTLEFLGRADQQVKIRGHRIELGEVESVLGHAPGVGRAVAAVAGEGTARHLVAAVVPEAGAPDAAVTVRRPDPSTSAFRTRAGEAEARVAESFLARLLGLDGATFREGLTEAQWAERLGIEDAHLPVLRLWLAWLVERDVLRGKGAAYLSGSRAGQALAGPETPRDVDPYLELLDAARMRLTERLEDFRAVLRGRLDPRALLDDDVLAPSRLSAADPGSTRAADELAQRIAELSERAGRPADVVQMNGGEGRSAEQLLESLPPGRVRLSILDPDPDMLDKAAARLAGLGHEVHCIRQPSLTVPAELRHAFDVVVADQALHRFPDPSHGPTLAALLVRSGGTLLAVERAELTPVALLTAALLDHGYTDFDRGRRAAGTPLLPPDAWARLLSSAGFDDFAHHSLGASFSELLTARRPTSATDLDPEVLRAHVAGHLPAHMVPEHVEVLPRLPLSTNGKLDRRTVASAAAAPTQDPDEPPSGELERTVAALWADLLGAQAVGRSQSFFALGGDSLLATRFLSRVEQRLGVQLPLRQMFAAPTVARVAQALERELAASGSTEGRQETEEGAL
ncbi:non-ribosomal peptide synthetase [Streptomyces sulphureus]|uniref:non-ribosomal peptide synthetase n=1 Tax=Streptomyces sulphureus TaxID=47758 RepID=UPI00036E4C0C|nr:non-ribosomal peptide synthetase [Streptomyces sulphureus]